LGGLQAFLLEFRGFFPGIAFVIHPLAAVTVMAAGGATPPKVKERGWFPRAASLGQRWPSDAIALGFFYAHCSAGLQPARAD